MKMEGSGGERLEGKRKGNGGMGTQEGVRREGRIK